MAKGEGDATGHAGGVVLCGMLDAIATTAVASSLECQPVASCTMTTTTASPPAPSCTVLAPSPRACAAPRALAPVAVVSSCKPLPTLTPLCAAAAAAASAQSPAALPPMRLPSYSSNKPILPALPSFNMDAASNHVDGLQQAAVQLALLAEFNKNGFHCDMIKRDPMASSAAVSAISKPKVVKPRRKRKQRVPDSLYCRSCGSTETPEWRRGPDGEKSLCNACGLHFAKILRREQLVRPTEAGQTKKGSIDFLLN